MSMIFTSQLGTYKGSPKSAPATGTVICTTRVNLDVRIFLDDSTFTAGPVRHSDGGVVIHDVVIQDVEHKALR